MAPLARWCFRHRLAVLALWIAGLVVLSGLSRAAGDRYSDSFSLPGTESTHALKLLQRSFAARSGDTDQIVLHATGGSVTDPATRRRAAAMLARVRKLPHVVSVVSPYSPQGARQISRDGRTAYATVDLDKLPQDIPKAAYQPLIHTAQATRSAGCMRSGCIRPTTPARCGSGRPTPAG
jgi:RND superfamily putative drug exporter